MFYYDIVELQRASANQFIKKRGAGYVPNHIVNSLSRCAYPLSDSSDPIQRDTVIEETECRLGRVRRTSLHSMRRVLM